jgi:predicted AlkP superfamily pyrophosphatase or phosphodiesterase
MLLLLVAGCGATIRASHSQEAEAKRLAPAHHPSLVLVTIDGVRAGDVFDHPEALPALHALMARGVGMDLVASGPRFVSLPGYREILTGDRKSTRLNSSHAQLRA